MPRFNCVDNSKFVNKCTVAHGSAGETPTCPKELLRTYFGT